MSAAGQASAAARLGPERAGQLRDAAKTVAYGLALYAAVLLVGSKLQSRSIGALALQMVIAEWGAGRLAVAWSDPASEPPTVGAIAKRIGRGVALGALAGGAAILFLLASHGLAAHPNRPELGQLALGAVSAGLLSARDELLLRGISIRAFRRVMSPTALLLACGVAGAAARYGQLTPGADVSPAEIISAALLAMSFAALWIVDRGGWLAFGAHASWLLVTGTLIRGGLADLRPAAGAPAGSPFESSLVSIAVLAAAALASAGWSRRAQKR